MKLNLCSGTDTCGRAAFIGAARVTFQGIKTWKASTDPDYAVKKARVEHLYAIAGREVSRADTL